MLPKRRPCFRRAAANGSSSRALSQRNLGQSGLSETYIFASHYEGNMRPFASVLKPFSGLIVRRINQHSPHILVSDR